MQFCEREHPLLVILGCSSGGVADLFCLALSDTGYAVLDKVDVCAINRASELVCCQIAYSFHADHLVNTYVPRGVFSSPHLASCNGHQGVAHYPLPREKQRGSSALQAAWLALEEWGYAGVIFAGVALGERDCFGGCADYSFFRKHWPAFAAVHGERCRAMSGYTAELFGQPDPAWVESVMEVATS